MNLDYFQMQLIFSKFLFCSMFGSSISSVLYIGIACLSLQVFSEINSPQTMLKKVLNREFHVLHLFLLLKGEMLIWGELVWKVAHFLPYEECSWKVSLNLRSLQPDSLITESTVSDIRWKLIPVYIIPLLKTLT